MIPSVKDSFSSFFLHSIHKLRKRAEMREPEDTRDESPAADANADAIGDVETAGETTAAAAIKGPVDDSPVGAETLANINISDKPATDQK
jgi:hypothetical protein